MTNRARPLLPLTASGPHGSRSSVTCHYRCGDACARPEANPTSHESMRDLVERSIARRSVLAAVAVGAGALVMGQSPAAAVTAARATPAFTPVAPNRRDAFVVPAGFDHHVVMSWGDPVVAGAPRFDAHKQTPSSAAKQFGYNCDYIGVVQLSATRAVLVVNHEYTNEELMFPAGVYSEDVKRRIAIASHGLSVVELRRESRRTGAWRAVPPSKATYNRRITGSTPISVTGPAAGHPRLRTTADPSGTLVRGTLNNCSGGTTPWGTVLTGEENFDQYFSGSGATDPAYDASYARYGISGDRAGRNWKATDPRFDLTKEPHEPFRFGWVVEVDPTRPKAKPRKHTMLGRLQHEGANVAVAADGRVGVYMGDDSRGEYVYKFVSRDPMATGDDEAARLHNATLLEHGTLHVARFTGDGEADGTYDGTGVWIPLTSDTDSYVEGMTVAEVLIDTRLAADSVAPTRMDRPEDIQPNPVNRKVYCALTNNADRGTAYPADEANPITTSKVRSKLGKPLTTAAGNRNGYVLELTEQEDEPTATAFDWELLLVCGDPAAPETYFAGYPKDEVSPISCPDNVAFDPEGNLWISTDSSQLGANDGLFKVPVSGAERGHVEQFLSVPRGAECAGPFITDDGRAVFVSVQHPGEEVGSTFDDPAATWPHTHPFPRPSVVVTYQR